MVPVLLVFRAVICSGSPHVVAMTGVQRCKGLVLAVLITKRGRSAVAFANYSTLAGTHRHQTN